MKTTSSGVDYSKLTVPLRTIDISKFKSALLKGLSKNKNEITQYQIATAATFRPAHIIAARRDHPEEAGWMYMVGQNADVSAISDALSKLTEFRGMKNPDKPIVVPRMQESLWNDWIDKNYKSLKTSSDERPPLYVMIVGDPNSIPIGFQTLLSTHAYVGRVDFDNIDALREYAKKVERIESNSSVKTNEDVLFFSTNHGITQDGCYDPTYYGHHYMEKPLVDDVKYLNDSGGQTQFNITEITETKATKQNLLATIQSSKPCLVYATCLGMSATDQDMETQKRVTGGICCEGTKNDKPEKDWLLTADDIPKDTSFAEGSIFFEYANFSYGTPAVSGISHWITDSDSGGPSKFSTTDFTSEIPKKLLANPHGPLAFVGNFDEVLLFSSPDSENLVQETHRQARLQPFSMMLKDILRGRPVGFALEAMTKTFLALNTDLTNLFNSLQAQTIQDENKFAEMLSDRFIRRMDAKNLMIFGDPAARANSG